MKRVAPLFFIVFFFILQGIAANAQEDFTFRQYCNLLLNLEFKEAGRIAGKHPEPKMGKELEELADILYYAGQKPIPVFSVIPGNEGSTTEFNVITNLKTGYDLLYHKPYTATSLPYFFKAYVAAKESQNPDLLKIALLGILEFYHFEFYHTNDQFKVYLEEFKALAEVPEEKAWAYIFEIYFISQSILEEQRSAAETIVLLENEIQKLPDTHKLLPKFLSLKAFQAEYAGDIETSIAINEAAFALCGDVPFLKYIKFRTCIRLADVYYKKKRFEKGLFYAEEARKYRDLSDTLRSEAYIQRYLSINNKGLGNYAQAFEELSRYDEIRNILDLKENTVKNSSLEIQLQTSEKEKQILIEQQKKINNRNIAIGLGIGLCAIICITILFYKNNRRKHLIEKQKRDIQFQKLEKELQSQEAASIDAMLTGQEKERQRLASELHDSVGSTLAAAKLQYNYIVVNCAKIEADDPIFAKTGQLLDEAYKEVRNMAHVKNTGVIAKEGLLPAIKKLAANASVASGLQIEVNDFGLDKRLENTLEITIFRIVQELVTNIIKHANATNASISITQHEHMFNIIIEDNGSGFSVTKSIKNGMGLSNLEKRVEHLDGTMEIDSTPNKGTTILIDIPL